MNKVINIFVQRADNPEVWDEAGDDEQHYTGNTIAVVEGPSGLNYDFSGCGEVAAASLDAFFNKIGMFGGSIWNAIRGQQPSQN